MQDQQEYQQLRAKLLFLGPGQQLLTGIKLSKASEAQQQLGRFRLSDPLSDAGVHERKKYSKLLAIGINAGKHKHVSEVFQVLLERTVSATMWCKWVVALLGSPPVLEAVNGASHLDNYMKRTLYQWFLSAFDNDDPQLQSTLENAEAVPEISAALSNLRTWRDSAGAGPGQFPSVFQEQYRKKFAHCNLWGTPDPSEEGQWKSLHVGLEGRPGQKLVYTDRLNVLQLKELEPVILAQGGCSTSRADANQRKRSRRAEERKILDEKRRETKGREDEGEDDDEEQGDGGADDARGENSIFEDELVRLPKAPSKARASAVERGENSVFEEAIAPVPVMERLTDGPIPGFLPGKDQQPMEDPITVAQQIQSDRNRVDTPTKMLIARISDGVLLAIENGEGAEGINRRFARPLIDATLPPLDRAVASDYGRMLHIAALALDEHLMNEVEHMYTQGDQERALGYYSGPDGAEKRDAMYTLLVMWEDAAYSYMKTGVLKGSMVHMRQLLDQGRPERAAPPPPVPKRPLASIFPAPARRVFLPRPAPRPPPPALKARIEPVRDPMHVKMSPPGSFDRSWWKTQEGPSSGGWRR